MESFFCDNPCVELMDRETPEEEILFANDKAEPPADMQWTSPIEYTPATIRINPLENNPGRDETLEDYLTRELSIAGHDLSVIALLDDKGFFPQDPDTLHEKQRIALRFIRTLEPKGLGALGLADCLCLQLSPDSLAYIILQQDEDLQCHLYRDRGSLHATPQAQP